MMKFNILINCSIALLVLMSACHTTHQKKEMTAEQKIQMINQGKIISQESFKALSGELSKALQEGGVQNAIDYCHLRANPVTDSLSARYDVIIRRISDKNRNPENKPDQLDITVLDAYRQQLSNGQDLQPHLEIADGGVIFYSPILIKNPMCLLCHGEPGVTIEEDNYKLIKEKYPEDLAVGYKLGDLRGVWKVIFSQATP